ncbi:MAG: hypothetical protein EGR74_03770 [Ruminiclostridium sp.]|nr:hypothetical protein [Ruminiclostridium sp.]
MQRKVAQKNNDCKQMFIAATQKTGYDIAVHKSQTKTGGRQYGFQRKVKADKKERGQAVTWLLRQILLGMFHKSGGGRN